MKVDHEIIQQQMAHTFGDKIGGSHDKSQKMEERRGIMDVWFRCLGRARFVDLTLLVVLNWHSMQCSDDKLQRIQQ